MNRKIRSKMQVLFYFGCIIKCTMSRVEAPLTPEQQDELYLPLIPDLRDIAHEGYGDPDRMKYHAWQSHIEPVR